MLPKKDTHLTFFEHLEELRGRIIKSLLAFVVASCLSYRYVEVVLPFLIRPVGKVVFTSPGEAFTTYFMLALFGGFFLSMPFILYQLWRFISIALTKDEQKYVVFFVPGAFVFFVFGCAFGYFVMLPMMLKFFLSFETPLVVPMINISKYISFIGSVIFSTGLTFELPLVMIFLTKVGIVTPDFLIQKRRHAIVFIFIASAILTPSPDCVSQFLMAVPLMILYEVSIIFSKVTYRLNSQASKTELDSPNSRAL